MLCVEGMSRMLEGSLGWRMLSRIKITRNCPAISHLFFADDSLLFFKACQSEALVVRNHLELYEKASGQMVNFDKFVITFSPNTNNNMKLALGTYFSIPVVNCHQQYLGLLA